MSGEVGFILRLPEGWTEYDLSGRELARAHTEARLSARTQVDKLAINDINRQVRGVLRTFVRRGALFAGGLVESYDEGAFMAFVAVFGVVVPEQGHAGLLAALRQGNAQRDDREVTSVDLLDDIKGARVTGVESVPVTDEDKVAMYAMTTVVPVPDDSGRHLVISAVSPNVEHAPLLAELFDVVTGTFRFARSVEWLDTLPAEANELSR